MLFQALPRLSHGLYGQAWRHVLRFHSVCGHGGRLGWHGASKTVVMCVAVDHVCIHVTLTAVDGAAHGPKREIDRD